MSSPAAPEAHMRGLLTTSLVRHGRLDSLWRQDQTMRHEQKILYIDNRSQYFIANRLHLALAARHRFAEVHVTALSRRAHDVETLVSHGLTYHTLRHSSINDSLAKQFLTVFDLSKLFKKLNPEFIHIYTLKAMCICSMALFLAWRKSSLMTITGLGYTFTSVGLRTFLLRLVLRGFLTHLLKRSSDFFIFQNPDDLSFFHDHFRFPPDRSFLIKGSGVDIDRFTMLPEQEGVPVVMLASRMLRDKGVFEFVEAAKRLKYEGVQAHFLLVGDTDPENPAGISTVQLKEWHNSGIVDWLGYSQDMLSLFSKAHIVCLPSYGEGLPKVLIEGAACGRPIVTTNVPGCREVVRHEENGLLVPPGDSEALAAALLRLIRDAKLRQTMGRRGRTLVENEFSLDRVINDTFKIYERLVHT